MGSSRVAVRARIAAVLGASAFIAILLSAFALYLNDLEWRQTETIVDAFEVAREADVLAMDVEKTVAQVMSVMVAEDAEVARARSVALQEDLEEVAQRRTSLLSRVGDRMSAAEKMQLSLRIDEFIAYQADTARLCLQVSPQAAIIQANDDATVRNRRKMLVDVQQLGRDMRARVEITRSAAAFGRKVRLAMLQVLPASTLLIGALVGVVLFRRRKANLQKRRYDVALNNMPLGVGMANAQGVLTVVNDRLATMFDIGLELSGCTVRHLAEEIAAATALDGEARVAFLRTFQSLASGSSSASFVAALGARHFEFRCHRMDAGGSLIVIDDVTAARRAAQDIERMALFDSLTGLSNRVRFRERLALTMEESRARNLSFSLLYLDLNAFKLVNDTLGHPTGDKLLCEVARRLATNFRDADLVARLGGDEFMVVLAPAAKPHDLDAICARLIEMVSAPCTVEGHEICVGASVGTASFPGDVATAEEMVNGADLALYRAKALGRSSFRHFDASMRAEAMLKREMETELRAALANDELELYYQPIVDTRSNRINTFEALLRWRHPVRGQVSPDVFIPLAEETGLIVEIGEWALDRACRDAALWPAEIRVAVNFSPIQFRRCDVVALVARVLATTGLAAHRLEIEITETILIRDAEATCAIFERLRGLGARLSLDDFGSGYSSLSYLNMFKFDKIKIDRAFVRNLNDPNALAVISAVTHLASRLDLTLVVEGVETQEQLAILSSQGVHDVQGFLFAPPMPLAEINRLVKEACRAA